MVLIIFWGLEINAANEVMEIKVDSISYSFKMEFETELNRYDALEVLYNVDHLKQYLKKNMNCKLLSADSTEYMVEFSLEKFFYKYNAQFKRVLDVDSMRVQIIMERFEQRPKNFPKAVKFNGQYFVTETSEGKTKIIYEQAVYLNGNGGWFFKKMVTRNLNNFANRITEYFGELESLGYNSDRKMMVEK